MTAQEIESYNFKALLKNTSRDLMLDMKTEKVYETEEISPERIYDKINRWEESSSSSVFDNWEVDYFEEPNHVFATFEKTYEEISVLGVEAAQNPVYSEMPESDLEVEISGLLDIRPENFSWFV